MKKMVSSAPSELVCADMNCWCVARFISMRL